MTNPAENPYFQNILNQAWALQQKTSQQQCQKDLIQWKHKHCWKWTVIKDNSQWQISKLKQTEKWTPNGQRERHSQFEVGLVLILCFLVFATWLIFDKQDFRLHGVGDSDVGDIVMLVTLWWWPIWQNHYVSDFFRYVGDFSNILNRSSTSSIGHQYLKLVTITFGLQHPTSTSM